MFFCWRVLIVVLENQVWVLSVLIRSGVLNSINLFYSWSQFFNLGLDHMHECTLKNTFLKKKTFDVWTYVEHSNYSENIEIWNDFFYKNL